MKTFAYIAAMVLAIPALAADKPRAPEVRALDLMGVRVVPTGDTGKPRTFEIVNDDVLTRSPLFVDAASRATIRSQVDFSKEKLVAFAWTGSGGDKLNAAIDKSGTVAVFTYTAGVTDDERRHAFVFAVPKDMIVELRK